MKIQWYKQLICYIFIAILFASGMQVDINNSHSYFACESTSTTEESQLQNAQSPVISVYCTNELLQSRNTQYVKNNTKQKSVIRRTPNYSIHVIDFHTYLHSNPFNNNYLTEVLSIKFQKTIIVEYMHLQDGAK